MKSCPGFAPFAAPFAAPIAKKLSPRQSPAPPLRLKCPAANPRPKLPAPAQRTDGIHPARRSTPLPDSCKPSTSSAFLFFPLECHAARVARRSRIRIRVRPCGSNGESTPAFSSQRLEKASAGWGLCAPGFFACKRACGGIRNDCRPYNIAGPQYRSKLTSVISLVK